MLTFRENCRIFYMALTKLAHPNVVRYNNKLVITIKSIKTLMKVKSSKTIFA
jgi:hypothetical protein